MMVTLADNPGRHNAGELISATMTLWQQKTDADGAAASAGSVARQVPEVWQGTDASACMAVLGGVRQHLIHVAECLAGQLAGLENYRVELDRIFRSFAPIQARIEVASAWLIANPEPPGMVHGTFLYGEAAVAAAHQPLLAARRQHSEEIADCHRAIERLWEERRAADRAVIVALATHRVSDWKSARQQLVDAGIADPRRATPAQVAEVMAAKSRDILGRTPPDPDSYGELKDLLDAYGYSAEHMDAFFTTLGGAGTAQLVGSFPASRKGGADSETSGFPHAIRSAFIAASQRWDDSEADAMAAALLPDVGIEALDRTASDPALLEDERGDHSGIAYLLSAGAIGSPLALALARRVDHRERIQKAPVRADTFTPLPAILHAETAGTQAADRAVERFYDPAGLIFSQLAHSPEDSLAFLGDPEGPDRIRYWYGRDGHYAFGNDSDQFEGVLAVWASASSQPADLDGSDWTSLAYSSGHIINTLAANSHFFEDQLSPAAVESLTLSMAVQLPGLLESSLVKEAGGEAPDGVVAQVKMPDGTARSAAVLDDGPIASVLARIYESGGAVALDAFTTSYSAALTHHAAAIDNPNTSLAAGERLVELNALMDAASDGASIRQASHRDESAMAVIKPAEFVGGLLPVDKVPGIKLLAEPVRKGLLGVADHGIGEGATLAESLWASNERHAVAAAEGREVLRRLRVESAVTATLAQAFNLTQPAFAGAFLGPDPGKAEDAYQAWIDEAGPAVDQEIIRRLNDLADRAGVSRQPQLPSVGKIVAGYQDDYTGMRDAVTK